MRAVCPTASNEQGAAMAGFDLTDFQRPAIQPLVPAKRRGKSRNRSQSFLGELEHIPAVATRHDRRAGPCLAPVRPAPIRIQLRTCEAAA